MGAYTHECKKGYARIKKINAEELGTKEIIMKNTVKIGNLEFNDIKLNDVEMTVECSANEAIKIVSSVGDIIKKLPEVLEDLKAAYDKVNEIEREEELDNASLFEDFCITYNQFINELDTFLKLNNLGMGIDPKVAREWKMRLLSERKYAAELLNKGAMDMNQYNVVFDTVEKYLTKIANLL